MIRLTRIPSVPFTTKKAVEQPEAWVEFLISPDLIVSVDPLAESARDGYPGARAVVSTMHPACDGIVVRETMEQVAMLKSGWDREVRLKDTSLSTELPLFTRLSDDGAFARIEKVLAR